MRIFIFSLQTAFKNLWSEKWINFLTVLSISIGLLILSTFAAITLNMDAVIKRWAMSFGLVVYIEDNLSRQAEDNLQKLLQLDPDILEVKYISKDSALKELRQIMGKESAILEGFEDNPLPSSFELKLKSELLQPDLVRGKASQIKSISGIEEVQYGEKWLSSLNRITEIMKISTILLGSIIFVAIVFVTYSTIKIFFYRRKDEIETLKLLGATRSFIRLPFILEGLFIGLAGGIVSSLSLFGIYTLIAMKIPVFMPSIKAIMVSLPPSIYLSVPPAGAVMSFIGSFIAVGKIKY
jgi:cell division transport system permease protein